MPRVSCPFCNSTFDAPATGPAACPRCGEALPGRGAAPAALPPAPVPTGRGWVLPALLVVVVAAAAGGYFALRPRPDPAAPPAPDPVTTVVAPAQLGGLALLPAEANVVLGVQPGRFLDYAKRTNQNPVELLTKAGVPAGALAALGQAGVPLDAVDHLAAGAFLPDADLTDLRLAVALVLRRPVPDEGKFLDALKARRPAAGTPPHHAAEFAGLPAKVAKATETTWLIGWNERDLTPPAGGLSDRMRAAIAEALPADAAAFVLTDSADWAKMKSVNLLLTLGGKADWQPGLAKVRAAAAGLTLAPEPTLRVMAQGATPAARDQFRAAFRRQPGTPGERGAWDYLDTPADRAGGLAAFRAILAPE